MKLQNDLTSGKIDICPMTENVIDDILEIQKECGLTAWTKRDYLNEIRRDDSIAKAAKSGNGRIIGFVVVRLLMNSDNLFDNSEIHNIAVRKSFQNKGIGQKIFDEILGELRKNDISESWLEVRESNKKAIKFYMKNGFEIEATRKNYYNNPLENGLIMNLSFK